MSLWRCHMAWGLALEDYPEPTSSLSPSWGSPICSSPQVFISCSSPGLTPMELSYTFENKAGKKDTARPILFLPCDLSPPAKGICRDYSLEQVQKSDPGININGPSRRYSACWLAFLIKASTVAIAPQRCLW